MTIFGTPFVKGVFPEKRIIFSLQMEGHRNLCNFMNAFQQDLIASRTTIEK